MNKLAKKISDSELEIMRVLWSSFQPLTLTEIRITLSQNSEWEDSTIKTLLRRLHGKGVLKQEKREVYYYTSLVTEAEYEAVTTQSLLDKVYKGSAKNLVASMVSSNMLSDEDITELRKLFTVGKEDE